MLCAKICDVYRVMCYCIHHLTACKSVYSGPILLSKSWPVIGWQRPVLNLSLGRRLCPKKAFASPSNVVSYYFLDRSTSTWHAVLYDRTTCTHLSKVSNMASLSHIVVHTIWELQLLPQVVLTQGKIAVNVVFLPFKCPLS